MSIMSSNLIRHEVCKDDLKHLGAWFTDIESGLYRVSFKVDAYSLSYVYGMDEDSNFFLERVQPYILYTGTFNTEEEVVSVIRNDLENFQKLSLSLDFQEFIDLSNSLFTIMRSIENLYMHKKLSTDELASIIKRTKELNQRIQEIDLQSNNSDNKERP